MKPLPVAARYLTRNAERAMSGFLIRGVVEFITNARDSAYRMIERGDLSAREAATRPIEVVYEKSKDAFRLTVRDRFEGMSEETVRQRLLKYGERASEFDTVGVRGINARGAKDVGVLGEVRFRTIHNNVLTETRIAAGKYAEPSTSPATETVRSELQIASGNGTVVTLSPFPDTTVPNFPSLVADLEHHIELRYSPSGVTRIPVMIRENRASGGGREVQLSPFAPTGSLIVDETIPLPSWDEYSPEQARLRLYRSEDPLSVSGHSFTRLWRGEAGVVVVDGRTAHDLTFFRARRSDDTAAQYLFGQLELPQIPQMLLDFEEKEQEREEDATVSRDPLNPAQVTDPDRFGLNREHPFVQAVEKKVSPLIEQVLKAIEEDITPSAQERVGVELKAALSDLGEKLAKKLELAPGGARRGKDMPLGLSAIPGGVRLEIGDRKRVGLYYRSDEAMEASELYCHVRSETDAVGITSTELTLEKTQRDPKIYSGYAELLGKALTEHSLVEVSLGESSCFIRASVREPTEKQVELDRDLQFSRRSYTSTPKRRKRVDVWADPSLEGEIVEMAVEAGGVIELSTSELKLVMDGELGVATASAYAKADRPIEGRLTATWADLKDDAALTFRELDGSPKIEFEFIDKEKFGAGRRFQWDLEEDNLLLLAARHETLSRVLGPDLDAEGNKWPGQKDPQTKAILAEIIAEAYVARRLRDELPMMGLGVENLIDPVDYENYRYRMFEDCYTICHEALTPPFGS